MATVQDAINLMRRCNSEGVRVVYPGRSETIGTALQRIGVTAEQAAKAARRLKWCMDDPDEWVAQGLKRGA